MAVYISRDGPKENLEMFSGLFTVLGSLSGTSTVQYIILILIGAGSNVDVKGTNGRQTA